MLDMRTHYINNIGGHICLDYAHAVMIGSKILTLNSNFVATRFKESWSTLFQEVSVLRPLHIVTDDMRDVFNAHGGVDYQSIDDFLLVLIARLKEIVLERWNPEMSHIIMHSSGLDSRMLSYTIRSLYEELGDEWLGDVVFVCSKWEGDSFKQIMRYEGWQDHQYFVVREDVLDQQYYRGDLLDFDNAWLKLNGASAIPINLFWWLGEWAETEGHIPFDRAIQTWTGQWGNTVLDCISGPEIRKVFKWFYNSVLCYRSIYGYEVVQPYTDTKLAKLVVESNIKIGKKLRPMLLEKMDPQLAKFVNMRSDGDRHRRIADDIIDAMIDDYQGSWYGKRVHPEAVLEHRTTEFQPFWAHWSAASLCEYLLAEGCKIEIV